MAGQAELGYASHLVGQLLSGAQAAWACEIPSPQAGALPRRSAHVGLIYTYMANSARSMQHVETYTQLVAGSAARVPAPQPCFPPKTRPHLVAPIRSKCQHSAAQSPGVLQRALATCLRRVAPPRVSQGTNSLMVRNKFHTQKHGWTYHQLNPRRSINMTVPDRVL